MESKKGQKELRFRIYYGYGSGDYIQITDNELERAKYAWQTGAIFTHGIKSVKGSEFKRIEPDFRHYTGWLDSYEPKESADNQQMLRDMPPRIEFEKRSELAEGRVRYIIQTEQPQLLQSPERVDALLLTAHSNGKTYSAT